MRDPKDKMFKYYCRGVIFDRRDWNLNITENLQQIFNFIYKELVSENQSSSSLTDVLKFNENDNFLAKIHFVHEKIDSFSIEINKNNTVWLESFQIGRIKNFYLSKNKFNSLKILNYQGMGVLNTTVYSMNLNEEESIISYNEERMNYLNYTSFFSKMVSGSGLHQQVSLDFSLESTNQHFSRDIYKGKCSLLIIDYLDDTDYIDIEEMMNDPSYVQLKPTKFFN